MTVSTAAFPLIWLKISLFSFSTIEHKPSQVLVKHSGIREGQPGVTVSTYAQTSDQVFHFVQPRLQVRLCLSENVV